jgi:hypothetical protein
MDVDSFSNERSTLNRGSTIRMNTNDAKESAGSGIQFTRLVNEKLNLVIGLIVVRNASTIGPNELFINERLASLTNDLKICD